MALVRTKDLVAQAAADGRAVPSFNVITLEHAEAIASGVAQAATGGALLQVSHNAIRYHGGALRPLLAACREIAEDADCDLAIHCDHFVDESLTRSAIAQADELGISSLMFDAATLPYDENVALTAEIVRIGHEAGLWIEGELGEVGGKDGAHAPGVRTRPDEAVRFVADTGVDGLAVAVGNSHAMTERSAKLDVELIAELDAAVPVPLVLHGSSGVADDELRAAVAAGMRKINIGTILNVSLTGAVRERLAADQRLTDPRKYLTPGRDAMAATVAQLCSVLATR